MFFANSLTKATKIIAIWILLLLAVHQSSAQNEYNVWYFGDRAGLSFNSGKCAPPVVLVNSSMRTIESSGGICDSAGNLLFYTNGDTVYNRLHQPMKNGIFSPYYYRASSIQGSIVLPVPGSSHLYYLFNARSIEFYATNQYFRYSIIDMQKQGGLGEVILANQQLLPNTTETIGIAQHANGIDYWITSIDRNTGSLLAVRTENGSFNPAVISQPFTNNSFLYQSIKFSPDSRYIKGAVDLKVVGAVVNYYVSIFKFNNATGALSDKIEIPVKSSYGFGFGEFSLGSGYLYLLNPTGLGPTSKEEIVQYDLSVWQRDSVINSAKTISSFNRNVTTNQARGLQLGPDGKIYVFHPYCDSLSVIDYPDSDSAGCGFQHKTIPLAGRKSLGGSPYYPSFWFKNRIPLCLGDDKTICRGDSVVLDIKAPKGATVKWNTSDTTTILVVKKDGTYMVTVQYGNTSVTDSITIKVMKPFIVYLGSDTAFCKQFAHLLDAGKGAKNYLWNTGDTTVTKLVNQPGMYAVTIKDSNSCENGDTIVIGRLLAPKLSLEKDTIGCKHVSLSVDKQDSSIKYLWSTGDTTQTILVNKKGNYLVTASNLFCSITSSITVDALPAPELKLGQDTGICEGNPIELDAGKWDSYQWNTGQNVQRIIAVKEGNYWVTVTHNGCKTTDTITLYDKCDMWYFIPNAFLPNGHELNNVFHVTGGSITELTLQIFDRWGELIYSGSGLDASWDGSYKSKPCPDGAYMYIVSVKGLRKGRMVKENISGVVTLLR